MPVTAGSPLPEIPASEAAAPGRRLPGSGFWAVAFAFLVVMAVATLPSPLYGLYRTRDHLSVLTITVTFAIFAASTIAVLLWDSSITGRIGRRDTMLASVATMMVAVGTAITYLVELRLRADPKASVVRARTIGTSVTIGALGVGPLIARCLAQWVARPLTVPYLVFVGLGVIALAGLWAAPETGGPAPPPATGNQLAGPRRGAGLPVPAAAGTLAAFSANGLFAGLVLLVVSVRVSTASLALFLIAGALIGAGSGAAFKGTSGIVLEASPRQSRVAMTSALLIALYAGLSVPVIGVGIALDLGASAPNTALGFAILVGLGVVGSGRAMLRRRP